VRRDDLHTRLAAAGLNAVLALDDPTQWEAAWRALAYQPVSYSAPMLSYQNIYFEDAGWAVHDLSLVLLNDRRPCGLWPLRWVMKGSPTESDFQMLPIAAPLFVDKTSPITRKKLVSQCIAAVHKIASALKLPCIDFEQIVLPSVSGDLSGVTDWHQQSLVAGAKLSVKHELFCDLRCSMVDIRSGFRKSYRPLINAGLKIWSVDCMDQTNANAAVWQEFRQLHRNAAGRDTRNVESWERQWSMLVAGGAFLVTLRDPSDQRLVGGGFFQYTRDEGLYAVGAYDRSLFDKPLGHVVQFSAIDRMKSLGLTWYRIGERPFIQDLPSPTSKQLSIGEFKQGFASHLLPRFEWQLSVSGSYS
jgi:FemAB family protein